MSQKSAFHEGLHCFDDRKFNADAILFGENQCKKKWRFKFYAVISVCFCLKSGKMCQNNYHTCLFHFISTCWVPQEMLNTLPDGLVFKQLPWDLANVNA